MVDAINLEDGVVEAIALPPASENCEFISHQACQRLKITSSDNEGDVTTAIGWGALWQGGPSPDILNYVDVKVVDIETCKRQYDENPFIQVFDTDVCAGEEGLDSCQVAGFPA